MGTRSVAEVVAGSSEAPIKEYSSPNSRGQQTCAKLAIDSLKKPKGMPEFRF